MPAFPSALTGSSSEQLVGPGHVDLDPVSTTYELCVKSLNVSVPQFPHFSYGFSNGRFSNGVVRINIVDTRKAFTIELDSVKMTVSIFSGRPSPTTFTTVDIITLHPRYPVTQLLVYFLQSLYLSLLFFFFFMFQ